MCRLFSDPNLVVQSLIAVATFLAVIAALFLKEIRSRWLPPVLKVELSNEYGHLADSRVYPDFGNHPEVWRMEKSRYYHLKVSNPRRKADAVNNVFMSLLRVERKGGDGEYHQQWRGDIPFQWRNEVIGQSRRVVGTWAEADLCHVLRGKWLELAVEKVIPHNLTRKFQIDGPEPMTPPFDIAVTVQARGNEVDSEVQRWRIFWDGQWKDGEVEMREHFYVTRLDLPKGWKAPG